PAVVRKNLAAELPFLASELLMMEAVRGGADRQVAHERLRVLSRSASEALHRGEENPLRELIGADPLFRPLGGGPAELLSPVGFAGRAPEQVLEFVAEEVDPLLARHADVPELGGEVRV